MDNLLKGCRASALLQRHYIFQDVGKTICWVSFMRVLFLCHFNLKHVIITPAQRF